MFTNKRCCCKNGGALKTLGKGQHDLKGVSWVMHDSVAYLFPNPVSVNVSNATAIGNWREITHQASTAAFTFNCNNFNLRVGSDTAIFSIPLLPVLIINIQGLSAVKVRLSYIFIVPVL